MVSTVYKLGFVFLILCVSTSTAVQFTGVELKSYFRFENYHNGFNFSMFTVYNFSVKIQTIVNNILNIF